MQANYLPYRGEEKGKSSRTEGATFRLKSDMLQKMRSEASQRGISLNALVNQIFVQFLEWDNVAPKGQMVPLPRPVLISLMEAVTDEGVVKLAEDFGKNPNRNLMLMLRNTYDIESVLGVMEAWAKASGFPYRKDYANASYKYILNHDMGSKWSLYFYKYFNTIFEDLGKKVIFDHSDNMLVFTIDLD